MKGTHLFTPNNDEFNSVEGLMEIKGIHASTSKNDEFNFVEGQPEKTDARIHPEER
jgi:hypothetical protein